jgi:hypothetical protein
LKHHVTCQRKGNQIIQTVDGDTHTVMKATGAITASARIRIGSHVEGGDWYRGTWTKSLTRSAEALSNSSG